MIAYFYNQVAKDTITGKFVAFLQETQYKLDREQRKLIRKYVKANFAVAANAAITKTQTKMLESQSLHQQPRIGDENLLVTNNADGQAPGLGKPNSYREELSHGPTETAPKTENVYYINYKAVETPKAETLDEKEALPGHSEPSDGSSLINPNEQVKKIPVPKRCISCRARHIKCVPLGTGCTFRRVDGGHNMFFSSKGDPLSSGQGKSISHVINEGNELSWRERSESVPMSQGPGLKTRPVLVGTEPPDEGQPSCELGHRSRSPTEAVNESAVEGKNITESVNTVDFYVFLCITYRRSILTLSRHTTRLGPHTLP